MRLKVSDYIVEYLIGKRITDVFGSPGGMVTHLMDSLSKYQDRIKAHVTYNEQGAAIAACGYAQVSGKTGIAYATSGPGATNMITGICNAYMDSIPALFIPGQVNSFEQKGNLKVRQRGFQETDIVSMVSTATKFVTQVNFVIAKSDLVIATCRLGVA
jgi:Thiamine pyrophosphate-requiring enzymes [acetolactate synthase, pyruvate dehydrogenase (cytochrome), glyoxylate carboligase, phosphonopyruvate decarboxylase]